jgi:hypothetical protein
MALMNGFFVLMFREAGGFLQPAKWPVNAAENLKPLYYKAGFMYQGSLS